MSKQHLLRISVLAAASTSCSQSAPEPATAAVQSTPEPSKPSEPTVESTSTPSSSVVFEVTPDHPQVKLDRPSVQLAGTPVITWYKDGAAYDYAVRLHDGPAGAKLTCADYADAMDKSPVTIIVSGKSPARPKEGETLTDARGEIRVTGQQPINSGGIRGLVVTFTKASDAAMSGTVALPEASAAAKSLAGTFHNAIVCEET